MITEAKKVLSGISKKYEIEKKSSEVKVMEVWNDFIATKFPVKTCATSFKGGILHVSVEKPTWTQELTVLKALLIEELNKICKADKVKDVRLHTGEISVKNVDKDTEISENDYDLGKVEIVLENEELSKLAKESAEIRDDELRMKFANLRAKNLKFRETMESGNRHKCIICREYDILENEMCSKCFQLCDEDSVIEVTSILKEDVTLHDEQIRDKKPLISSKEIKVARLLVSNSKKEMLINYVEHYKSLDLENIEFVWRMAEEYVWARFSMPLKELDPQLLTKNLGENVVEILNATKIN